MAWISFPKSFCRLSAGATTVVPLVPAASPSRRSNPPLPLPLPSLSQFTALAKPRLPSTCILASKVMWAAPSHWVQTAEGEEQATMPPVWPKVPKGLHETLVCFLASDALSLGIGYAGWSQSTYIHWAPKQTRAFKAWEIQSKSTSWKQSPRELSRTKQMKQ